MTNTTEEFHPDRLRGFSYFFVCFSCVVLSVLLLLLLVLVAAAHGDKAVRRVGLTFLCYLVVGAMCGQGFLISHGVEALRVSQSTLFIEHGITTVTWADCHAQSALLVSMLAMLAIPLMAKSWRVYSKIRTAETHRLHLWDATAQRLTALQLFVIVGLVIGHLIWSSYDNAWDETRTDCVDETQSGDRSGDTATVERYLYFTQTLIIVLVILPFPYLLLQVPSESPRRAASPPWRASPRLATPRGRLRRPPRHPRPALHSSHPRPPSALCAGDVFELRGHLPLMAVPAPLSALHHLLRGHPRRVLLHRARLASHQALRTPGWRPGAHPSSSSLGLTLASLHTSLLDLP